MHIKVWKALVQDTWIWILVLAFPYFGIWFFNSPDHLRMLFLGLKTQGGPPTSMGGRKPAM